MLDDKGRCCGRKPLEYRGTHTTSEGPHRYCPRCDRAYELDEPFQINNWAWKKGPDGEFHRQTNKIYPKETL